MAECGEMHARVRRTIFPRVPLPFRLLRRTLGATRVNSCAMQELLLFIQREKHTPRHPLAPSGETLRYTHPRASSQFSRMGTPREGSRSLVATARGGHSAAAHNRRPRRWVHLTLQIHNSLTLCRAKRPAATALMDTDKWSLEESRSRSPASSASSSFVSASARPIARRSREERKCKS